MTSAWLTNHATVALGLQMSAWLAAGALLGAFYFHSLRWNVRMLTEGRALLPIGLQLFRFALLAAAFAAVARTFGAMPLLLATMGLLMARTAAIRWETQP